MRHVVFSDESLSDLEAIWDSLAGESDQAASRVVTALIESSLGLAQFPFAHPRLQSIPAPDIRRAVLRQWVILYQVEDDHVTVLRIVYGGRDIEALVLPR